MGSALKRFFALLAPAVLIVGAYHFYVPYSLAWNSSESIPRGLYLAKSVTPEEVLARGQIACFGYVAPAWAADRKYFSPKTSLCKFVYGLPGDSVSVAEDQVVVHQSGRQARGGMLIHADSKGRPLVQSPSLAGVVPPGYLVLLAPQHANSLDSRYLGRIPRPAVNRTLQALATY